jgi:hypothetical protein
MDAGPCAQGYKRPRVFDYGSLEAMTRASSLLFGGSVDADGSSGVHDLSFSATSGGPSAGGGTNPAVVTQTPTGTVGNGVTDPGTTVPGGGTGDAGDVGGVTDTGTVGGESDGGSGGGSGGGTGGGGGGSLPFTGFAAAAVAAVGAGLTSAGVALRRATRRRA